MTSKPTESTSLLCETRGHASHDLALIQAALRNRWRIRPEVMARLPDIVQRLAESSDDDRIRVRAVEVLRQMVRDDVDAAVHMDRIQRLDTGNATERIEFAPMKF